jgi:acyl-CoA hydrolase
VVTPRADVHTVVTEHGVAVLYGKSIRERVDALMGLAAPEFRGELEQAVRDISSFYHRPPARS